MSKYQSNSRVAGARRMTLKATVAAMAAAVIAGVGIAPVALAQTAPVTINVVDVAGNLALTQDAFELYAKKNPTKVAKFTFTKAPAPELPGKLKAMQDAGRSDIDLVLTGVGFLGNAVEQGLLVKLVPDHAAKFPGLMANYQPAAAKMQELAQGQGIEVTFMPAGPLLEYNPAKVKQPPTTAQELLAWCKANPNRLIYARPANSGPGNTFIMGLPYILGDKDPKDPVNGWEKTWAYLKDLNSCIEYYPTGTAATMKELGRRFARHDGVDDRLGHQPARARHRAQGFQGHADQGHDLDQRCALHGRAQGCRAGKTRGDPRRDGVHAHTRGAGLHV